MTKASKRWLYAVWLAMICSFAVLHALNLRADFPNQSPWISDWAKYTDEGWYGSAAVRAHLFGNWHAAGDFNTAPAVPVWPFLEWLLFFFTGVTIQAARGLAIAFFFVNLLLSYLLLRVRGQRWTALFALTLLVTSPFLYCFSRLAILEPMLTALTLGALNLAIRLPRMRRPVWSSIGIGLLFTLMMLTKTTAIFLLPALGWAMLLPLWLSRKTVGWKLAVRCVLAAAGAFAVAFGLWMSLIVHFGLLADYKYFFKINDYARPPEFYWPLVSFWWSLHGALWIDHILIPLAGLVVAGAVVAWEFLAARKLILDPVFGASVLAAVGYILFMTFQNHPQPRYFAVVAVFTFILVAQGAEALLGLAGQLLWLGVAFIALAAMAVVFNGIQTLTYAAHPEYTFVDAAQRLARYIDEHPNGKRLLVSISGDQMALVNHLPTLCDDFGTQPLPQRLAAYQPGWYSSWNNVDSDILVDLHTRFSLEQVASYRVFDDPKRNLLVLFKLHPLPGGQVRDPNVEDLDVRLPDDKMYIPVD